MMRKSATHRYNLAITKLEISNTKILTRMVRLPNRTWFHSAIQPALKLFTVLVCLADGNHLTYHASFRDWPTNLSGSMFPQQALSLIIMLLIIILIRRTSTLAVLPIMRYCKNMLIVIGLRIIAISMHYGLGCLKQLV